MANNARTQPMEERLKEIKAMVALGSDKYKEAMAQRSVRLREEEKEYGKRQALIRKRNEILDKRAFAALTAFINAFHAKMSLRVRHMVYDLLLSDPNFNHIDQITFDVLLEELPSLPAIDVDKFVTWSCAVEGQEGSQHLSGVFARELTARWYSQQSFGMRSVTQDNLSKLLFNKRPLELLGLQSDNAIRHLRLEIQAERTEEEIIELTQAVTFLVKSLCISARVDLVLAGFDPTECNNPSAALVQGLYEFFSQLLQAGFVHRGVRCYVVQEEPSPQKWIILARPYLVDVTWVFETAWRAQKDCERTTEPFDLEPFCTGLKLFEPEHTKKPKKQKILTMEDVHLEMNEHDGGLKFSKMIMEGMQMFGR